MMDMPVTASRVSLTQAADDLKARDALLRGFPEVESVIGQVGRAETATDPAGLDMVETLVNFRPKELWPRRVPGGTSVGQKRFSVPPRPIRRTGAAGLEPATSGTSGVTRHFSCGYMVDNRSETRLITSIFELERSGPAWLDNLVQAVCCPYAARLDHGVIRVRSES